MNHIINPKITKRLSTGIKDAGIAVRHSRGRILFYTAGSRNGLKGAAAQTQNNVVLLRNNVFYYRKNILGRQAGTKNRQGINNEITWSYERRVMEDFVQNASI